MPASPLAADDFAMPVEMEEVRAGRVLAVYRKPRRHAPLAVFIHGSCARMTQWRAQSEHLTATHGVLAFDLLGCGRSEKPRGWNCYSIDEHLADVLALVLKETEGQPLRHLLLSTAAVAGFGYWSSYWSSPNMPNALGAARSMPGSTRRLERQCRQERDK